MEDAYELDSILNDIKNDKSSHKILPSLPSEINDNHIEFHTLTSTKRGFILGGDKGTICINEIKNSKI